MSPNPLTQDTETAWQTIRKSREGEPPEDNLAMREKAATVRRWLTEYREAVEAGDAREMTRLTGWLEDMEAMQRDVYSNLGVSDA